MSVEPIKIALIAEGEHLPAWQYLMIERLVSIPEVVLSTVIFQREASPPWQWRAGLGLAGMLVWLDALLFRSIRSAQYSRSVLDLLGDVTVCMAGSQRYWRLVHDTRVDVVLDLRAGVLLPETLAWGKQGVWRYFYGKPGCHTRQVLGIVEYATGQAEFVSGVERFIAGHAGSECLYQAGNSVDQASLSRSIEPALWKMADFVPRCLIRQGSQMNPDGQGDAVTSESGYCLPGLSVFMQALSRYPAFLLRKLYQKLSGAEQQWILLVGMQRRRLPDVLQLEHFQRLVPSPDRFWADPMLVEHPDGTWLFFEEFIYAQGKGHLACMKLHEDGQHAQPVKVLERPYHLSYPFVFKWQGQYYMIPETAENHTLEIYRCETFPDQWVFDKNLMEGVDAFDATLHEQDGRWWMFVNMRQHPGESPHESLYLFYADSPLSTEWQAHPQNPVVSSAASARPAGPLVSEGGVLYRPSQHCAGWYGRGVNLNIVRQLDTHYYREDRVSCQTGVQGGQYEGMHTLSLGKGLTVMDAIQPIYKNRLREWMPEWNHA